MQRVRNEKQMATRSQALSLLRASLSNPDADFRPGQWEAIDALVNHRRKLFVVERTGWGKSSVYFIATRMLRDQGAGPTIIISPLLALMRNQIESAQRLGISALTVNSTNRDEWPRLFERIARDEIDALLISPERLANDDFIQEVLLPVSNRIGLLVVDEAHCISDWGHDFRPDYQRLTNVLKRMPMNVPILGTTATANNRVIEDVSNQLGDIQIQRGPLMRESLALQTIRLPDQAARLAWLAEHVPQLPGTGIIYTLTKRDSDLVANWLRERGVAAYSYYSDVTDSTFPDSNSYRQHLEGLLLGNELKALVATTALGMGYDKPDLAFVIHYQAPGSIVAYYQQVGRAGRAIDRAIGVLLSGREDSQIQDYFRRTAFPDEEHVVAVLNALSDSDGLSLRELEAAVNLRQGQINKVLGFLSVENPAPVIKDGRNWRRTPVEYSMDREHIERLTNQRILEWREVEDYIRTPGCLMAYLARALDDPSVENCGKCARCIGSPILSEAIDPKLAILATRFVKQSEAPLHCNKQVAAGAFPVYGFKGNLPAELRPETGRILASWGDSGWGRLVAQDKLSGIFRDELVAAVVEMIRMRWKPTPFPTWVTCIPSQAHPDLVPDFSRRVALALGLPFVEAIQKIRRNEPQKQQQNRFHQCHNLDGAFEVSEGIPDEPVLLIDDVVDSGWTLTIAAALLRKAGSGPVWPLALASTSTRD